jgi:hypothetical protein
MPDPTDPTNLEGPELDRWYRRSPQEIERERQMAAARQAANFFGRPLYGRAPLGLSPNNGAAEDDPSRQSDDTLWITNGSGGYRPVRSGNLNSAATLQAPPLPPAGLPEIPAAPEEADLIDIGNPHNPRLRREWEKANGQPWPKTDDGRNYHVAHKRAIADGGTNTLDNIEPMHPDEHIAQHINNGDSGRWGARASIARTFGGTVEPPRPVSGRIVRGFGLLSMLPWITGFLSGNIRTDTRMHTLYDMAGYPAPDDAEKMVDPVCRAIGINAPGDKCT